MTQANDGRHDFDFFANGIWKVKHRRLKSYLAGDTRWDAFSGTVTTSRILDGLGTIDENQIDYPGKPYRGSSLRLFDPSTGIWSVYWIDGRFGVLEAPVRGKWIDGRCELTGDDVFQGKPVKLRFTYTRLEGSNPHWQQEMSADDGASWETNWHMDYSRA